MKRIDLHIHSNFSDGTMSPSEIVDIASSDNEISVIALTDHDTVTGIEEFINYNPINSNLIKIPGIEISADFFGTEIHILGFWINKNCELLNDFINRINIDRKIRNIKMLNNLQKYGYNISELYLNNDSKIISRIDMAYALKNKGYFNSIELAFNKCLSDDGDIYIPRKFPSAHEVINVIHQSHGIAFWAHPFFCNFNNNINIFDNVKKFAYGLCNIGIDGIEAYYHTSSSRQKNFILELSSELNIQVSGGSDFHGSIFSDIFIGYGKNNSMFIPFAIYENILDYYNKIFKFDS